MRSMGKAVSLMHEGCTQDQSSNAQWQPRVDWEQAQRSGLLEDFAAEVQAGLAPLLNGV